jgi:cell division protein FtsZ
MNGQGDALMGIGIGNGENRAVDAATNAINNPLLEDARIEGAKGILVNVSGGADFSLTEYEEVLNIITSNADDEAMIIAGSAIDELMEDEVKVTVIATGFSHDEIREDPEEEVQEQQEEFISLERWKQMTSGRQRKTQEDLFGEEGGPSDELGIPAVLRYRQASNQRGQGHA